MRRFRLRRRRAIATALLPLAALTTTSALAEAPAERPAQINASSRSVPIGESLRLQGSFPGAAKAAIQIRHRALGSKAWRTVARERTGASGKYSARVKPRRSGHWRAELAPETVTQSSGADSAVASGDLAGVDPGTGSRRVGVRSRIETKVGGRQALVGRGVKVSGRVTPAGAKRRVVVRIGKATETTTARRNGKFSVDWKAPATGRYPVKVRARSNKVATGSRKRAGAVTAYRQALASWYGPGLYGNRMGCGGTLTPSTIGVAHKTLPCGSKLRLRYRGRTVTARVVDRGPYSGAREFDLTSATRQALGFPDVGTVLSSR
jgi:hypothetical protein